MIAVKMIDNNIFFMIHSPMRLNIIFLMIHYLDNEAEVQIFFEITTDNGEDEAEEAFYLKVTDVQEF